MLAQLTKLLDKKFITGSSNLRKVYSRKVKNLKN